MHFKTLLLGSLSLSFLVLRTLANSKESTDAEAHEAHIYVEASFPKTNPFGHVVNGEQNKISLSIENRSGLNTTLVSMGGSFHDPDTNDLIKNTSTSHIGLPLPAGKNVVLPYHFHSEFRPGDLRLNVWLEHVTEGEKHRIIAYDSVVAIVEPERPFFDFQMLATYLILAAAAGGLSYYLYLVMFPKSKKGRARRPKPTPAEAVKATASGSSYQEEWIPVHHLKKGKGVYSGSELSGGETSGTEGKKKKGKK